MLRHVATPGLLTDRRSSPVQAIARLADGVTAAQAAGALGIVASELERSFPETSRGRGVELVPGTLLHGRRRGAAAMFFGIVMALVALVLIVASANVANLLLARAVRQRRDAAIQLALGARPMALVRQRMLEALALAAGAGAIGLIAAAWAAGALRSMPLLPTLSLQLDLALDWRVFTFAAGVSAITGVVAGVAPALQAARGGVHATLQDEGSGVIGGGRSWMRDALVSAQVAVSVVMLVGAALLLRSLTNTAAIDPGVDPRNRVAIDVDLQPHGMSEERGRLFYAALLERVGSLGEVEAAALSSRAPVDSSTPTARAAVVVGPDAGLPVTYYAITPAFFDTVGTPIVRGRAFTRRDTAGQPLVAIVNEDLVRRLWGGEDPVGRRLLLTLIGSGFEMAAAQRAFEVVGVARNARYLTLGEEQRPHVYLPFEQHFEQSITLIVHARGDAAGIVPALQREIDALQPGLQGFFARTLEEHLSVSLLPARVAATASGVAGAMALVLATVGLYAVLAFFVGERRREIGLRAALGAGRGDLLRLVLRRGLTLVGIGLGAGAVLAFAASGVLETLLVGVTAADPLSFAAVVIVLALAAAAACYLPARAASRLDPLTALRRG
jgi:predicted permease